MISGGRSPRRTVTVWPGLACVLVLALTGSSCSGGTDDPSGDPALPGTSTPQNDASSPGGLASSPELELVEYRHRVFTVCGLEARKAHLVVVGCDGTLAAIRNDGSTLSRTRLDFAVVAASAVEGGIGLAGIKQTPGQPNEGRVRVLPASGAAVSVSLGQDVPLGLVSTAQGLAVATLSGSLFSLRGERLVRLAESPVPLVHLADNGRVLLAVDDSGRILTLDRASSPATLVPGARVANSGVGVTVAAVGDSFWVATPRELRSVGPGGSLEGIDLPGRVTAIESCGGSVWIGQSRLGGVPGNQSGLRQMSPDGDVRATIVAENAPLHLACDAGTVWAIDATGHLGYVPE